MTSHPYTEFKPLKGAEVKLETERLEGPACGETSMQKNSADDMGGRTMYSLV